MMLNLADTSVRLYRKKNGKVSVKLRSYLMVETNAGFRLSAYLRAISCALTFPNGRTMEFDEVSFTHDLECKYQQNTMVHGFWASGTTEMKKLENGVGKLHMNYWLNFTGHPSEEPCSVDYVVPIIRRRSAYGL